MRGEIQEFYFPLILRGINLWEDHQYPLQTKNAPCHTIRQRMLQPWSHQPLEPPLIAYPEGMQGVEKQDIDLRWACVLSSFSCVWLRDPVGGSPPASFVQGVLQARILEWVALPSSRGSFWPRDGACISHVSCTGVWVLHTHRHLGSPGPRWLRCTSKE